MYALCISVMYANKPLAILSQQRVIEPVEEDGVYALSR